SEYAPIAYTAPIHTGGIGNTFKYKNFDLYGFFRWSYGNDIINQNLQFGSYFRGDINVRSDIANSFWNPTFPDNNYQSRTSLSVARVGTLFNRSEFVEDGSFLRFETLKLGYTLPKKLISKIGVKNVNVNLTAQNLFVLTRYSWYDPEVNTSYGPNAGLFPGVDTGSYPRSRYFLLGLDINL
ncbi:hypothetical protein N9R54_06225, partial [Pelobium sp.]|nr:hypothetical protein [Pelobium sp.]